MFKKVFDWKQNFLSGLLVVLPTVISCWLIWWVFNSLTRYVQPLFVRYATGTSFEEISTNPYFLFILKIGSLFLLSFLILLTGLFTRNYLGAKIVRGWDYLVTKIPFVNTVHGTFKQLLDTFIGKDSSSFNTVVLVEYPIKNAWVIGFLTAKAPKSVCEQVEDDSFVSVYVPTTPVPTSGFLIFYKSSDVKFVDMSVTEGMQLVISGGAVKPEDIQEEVTSESNNSN